MRYLTRALLVWLGLIATWFLFVYQISAEEAVAGVLASAVTVFSLHRTLKAASLRATFGFPWLSTLTAIPAATLSGLRMLLSSLGRHARGFPSESVWQEISFDAKGDEEEQGGRRSLVVLLLTLTPNSYVVGIDDDTHQMLVHSLENTPVPPMIRTLECAGGKQ